MPTPTAEPAATIDPIVARIEGVLRRVVTARRVAFVNFPNHSNAGDPALWLGGRRMLDRLGVRVVYQCEHRTYDPGALAAAEPEMILINGGGNFGDLWKGQQQCRERVLADFRDVPTVQLPQSIAFEDPANLARNQRLVAEHRALTLLLRDPRSLEYAQRTFEAPAALCPDLAFALGTRPRAGEPRHQLLWLARQDKESRGYAPATGDLDAQVLDWIGEVPDEPVWPRRARLARTLNLRLSAKVGSSPQGARRYAGPLARTYRPIAEAWVARGMSILARGEVVVTDRLHGHVLSLLQGIPHVVLDNSSGKVRALHEAFTAHSPLVRFAESPEEALAHAQELLADGGR